VDGWDQSGCYTPITAGVIITQLHTLSRELGLNRLPLAAMGDAGCDLPMLKVAEFAFLPAATLPSYVAPRGQRLMRSRYLGGQSL